MLRDLKRCPEQTKNTVILFADAVHLLHATVPGRVYMRKGTQKMIPTASGRKRLTILGALERGTHRLTRLATAATCNFRMVIRFCDKLLEAYADKARIIVILDNATYFHAKLVSQHILGAPIEFWFLPSSSPNLNLIERLWKFAKGKLVKDHYYPTFGAMQRAARRLCANLSKHESELASLLTDRFRILKYG